MELFNNILYFLIVIAVLVLIHEFGHFIAARLSGMRTEIFSFGMGFRLFGYNKKTGFTFGSLPDDWDGGGYCDYRVCLFPVGGYVKISGMVDESMDTKFINSAPQPYEFRSKNTFQKLFTISAGVIMNFLLAVIIFGAISFFEGKVVWKTTTVGYVEKKSLGDIIGLQLNDKILEINNKAVTTWNEVEEGLTLKDLGDTKSIKVFRNGNVQTLTIEGKSTLRALVGKIPLGLSPGQIRVYIRDVETLSPAGKLGLTANDTISAINGRQIASFPELTSLLMEYKSKKILLEWKRGNKIMTDSVVPTEAGKLGFIPGIHYSGASEKISYSLFEATANGFNETIKSIDLFWRSLVQIFKGNISAKESLGGPIMIAKSATQTAKLGFVSFMNFMALLSITLAVINILPFPALDGGHLIFILVEAIIRREVPVKVKMVIQNFGLIVLLLLMVFMFYNDFARIFNF